MIILSIFIGGYILGNRSIPKGLELQIMMVCCLIAGFTAGSWFSRKRERIRAWKQRDSVQLFGYEITKIKPRTQQDPQPNVVNMKKEQKHQPKQKNKIPCPKCKKKAAGG